MTTKNFQLPQYSPKIPESPNIPAQYAGIHLKLPDLLAANALSLNSPEIPKNPARNLPNFPYEEFSIRKSHFCVT